MAAVHAFRNPPAGGDGFGDGRKRRYQWFWRLYWNTAYDDLTAYAANYGQGAARLYRYTRGVRNPVGRYVDFYIANVWGGPLDLAAGDGKTMPSALPIFANNAALPAAIAKIWQWSNWAARRDIVPLHSTTLGDAFVVVTDRPASRRCYLRVRWPGEVADVDWDDFGHIKRLVVEYSTRDERGTGYTYREVTEHPRVWGGEWTRVQTFRDGKLFAYPENTNANGVAVASWTVPYTFVPAVHIPWRDVGQGWGAVGYGKTQGKIDAANALASQIADQVGKAVNTPLVAYGIQAGDVQVQQSEDGVPVLYVNRPPSEARIEPMIGDLNLEHGLAVLQGQLDEIKADLSELRMEEALRQGMSGEALGRAYSDVYARIQSVRAVHDAALVRAQQMAIAIAGAGRYDAAFAGFGMDSFGRGALDHAIGNRPVLPRTNAEQMSEERDRWTIIRDAVTAGVPLATALRELGGWSKAQIRALLREVEQERTRQADLSQMMLDAARRRFDAGDGGAADETDDEDAGDEPGD